MDPRQTPLFSVASAAAFAPRTLSLGSGSLLVTVRAARVLGVFLDGLSDNLLWTNPDALASPERAAQFVQERGWNIGGDRCWLSPEIELHFLDPDHPSPDNYAVPPGIDPGRYAVEHEGERGVALATTGEAHNLISERPFTFFIRRVIRLCPPPFDPAPLSYVGYEVSSGFRITSADRPEATYGLWHLLQVPAGGTAIVPVRGRVDPIDYFQTGVANLCRAEDRRVVFPMTGTARHKLGLPSGAVGGSFGYLRALPDGMATLIVRQASIFPGGVYADYPAHDRARRDIALQFYNNSATPAGAPSFGELEYHAPAACQGNFFHVRDVSRTWCFGGPAERVREVGRALLGVEMD